MRMWIMKLPNSPCSAPFVLRHHTGNGFIKRASMPPRTCAWTADIKEAEVFEHENEAQVCADFITKNAFSVTVFKMKTNDE